MKTNTIFFKATHLSPLVFQLIDKAQAGFEQALRASNVEWFWFATTTGEEHFIYSDTIARVSMIKEPENES